MDDSGLVQKIKRQGFRQKMENLLVKSKYVSRIYPQLKIQKPGFDFYNQMVMVQVFMCIYIIIFYPNMDADKSTNIVNQLSKNQFSGEMVIALIFQIVIMIIDRYIYKSKSFVESRENGKR
jgi:hypothetical protein